jgi:hypothetical protein
MKAFLRRRPAPGGESEEQHALKDMSRATLAATTGNPTTFEKTGEASEGAQDDALRSLEGQKSATETLKMGDGVFFTLQVENAGADSGGVDADAIGQGAFLLSEGFSDVRLGIGANPRNLRHCLFRVWPPQKYGAVRSFEKLQRRDSVTPEELRERSEAAAAEERRNAARIEAMSVAATGVDATAVVFGDTVQLQHVNSGKFLTLVPRAIAEKEKENMKLMLMEGGSEGSYFCFKPRWAMRSEGSPVYNGDQITLACKKLSGYHVRGATAPAGAPLASAQLSRDPLHRNEANASASKQGITWKLQRFAQAGSLGDDKLHFGEPLRLFHPEGRGFVCGTCNRRRSDKKPYLDILAVDKSEDECRAKTVFIVESAVRTRGGAVQQGSARQYEPDRVVRFRHAVTGRYLSVDYADSGTGVAKRLGTCGSAQLEPAGGAASADTHRTARGGALAGLRLVDEDQLVSERAARCTHFCLIPVIQRQDKHDETIAIFPNDATQDAHEAVRVFHHRADTGALLWLHDTGVEKEGKDTSTNATERGNGVNRILAFSEVQLDQDAVELRPVSVTEVSELAQISGTIDVLRMFCDDVLSRCARAPVTAHQAEPVLRALRELIFSALETTDHGAAKALECDGLPQPRRQQQMREMKVIDELFWALTYPMDPKRGGLALADVASKAGSHAVLLNVHRHVFKAIRATFQNNRHNENYIAAHTFVMWRGGVIVPPEARPEVHDGLGPRLAIGQADDDAWSNPERKYMDEIIAQLGDDVGASGCISSLLTDNRKLLEERVDSDTLNIFLNGIREKGPDAPFLEFLKSTASCQGAQVIPNQELVLKMCLSGTKNKDWICNRRELMLETMLDRTSDRRPYESKSDEKYEKKHNCKPEHNKFLGQDIHRDGLHEIVVGWSCKPDWSVGSSALFYEAGDLGLTPRTLAPPAEFAEYEQRAAKLGHSRPPDTSMAWVRLTELVWVLRPEELCETVTKKSWSKLDALMKVDSEEGRLQKQRFNRLKRLALYYHANLELFAELCLDRSYNCIEALSRQFPYDLLVTGMCQRQLPPRIRQAFADLCTRLWIDRFPHNPIKAPNLTRIWSDVKPVKELNIQDPDSLPQFRLQDKNPLLKLKDKFYSWQDANKFHLVEDIISDYVDLQGGRTVMENANQNCLTHSLLTAAQLLIRYGFYNTTEQIRDLVDPLVDLLDGRNDKMTIEEAKREDRIEAETNRKEDRHAKQKEGTWTEQNEEEHQAACDKAGYFGEAPWCQDDASPGARVVRFAHAEAALEVAAGELSPPRTANRTSSATAIVALGVQVDQKPLRWEFNSNTRVAHEQKVQMMLVMDSLGDMLLDFRVSQMVARVKEAMANAAGADHDPDLFVQTECENKPLDEDARRVLALHARWLAAPRTTYDTVLGDKGQSVTDVGWQYFEDMFGAKFHELDLDHVSEAP